MPICEFRGEQSGRVIEILYTIHDAPGFGAVIERDGERFVRIPSLTARPIIDSEERQHLRALSQRGIVPVERGMDRDAKQARYLREKQAQEQRRQVIADTLSSF